MGGDSSPPAFLKGAKMVNANNAVMSFLPGSKPTFSVLWNGKWKLDIKNNVIPDTREMPTALNSTNNQGIGYWLGKGYRPVEEVPIKDDGSYRFPPGTRENLLQEKKEKAEYAQQKIDEYVGKKSEPTPDVIPVLEKMVTGMDVILKRLEALENGGTNKKDDRPDTPAGKKGSKSKPKGNNKKGTTANRKRGDKGGAGSGQKTG